MEPTRPKMPQTIPEDLLAQVYEDLRRLARARMAQEQPGQTLSATALVHEAYLRLIDGVPSSGWVNRGHFFAAAAEAMRRILVERARQKGRIKRGAGKRRIDWDRLEIGSEDCSEEILELNDLVETLTAEDPLAGELAKLRLFAGVSVEEAGALLGLSRSSAFEQWAFARSWLQNAWK